MADIKRKYLWKAGNPDFRDLQFKGSSWVKRTLVRWGVLGHTDLTSKLPPVFDQGQLGSCTANAITAAVVAESQDKTLLSRLFLYWNERLAMGQQYARVDSGAIIRDGLKSVVKDGSIPEDTWPYDIETFANPPDPTMYDLAKKDLVTKYYYVPQDSMSIKCALLEGYPIVFGISVYESFEQVTDGNIPMPKPDEKLLGGHAILLVGFDNHTQKFKFRNSWGNGWGQGGYGFLPFDYVLNAGLASDFWIVEKTTV